MKQLVLIEDICLAIVNKGSVQFGMCTPNWPENDAFDWHLQRKTHFNVHDLNTIVETNLPKLLPKQCIVYVTIMQKIPNQRDGLDFLDAPGGSGKTF